MGSAEGQSRYYEAALWALRFVEARRATRRRFGPEADATWAAFRGDFGTSARIDLLLRDADAQWPGAFGARSVYDLEATADAGDHALVVCDRGTIAPDGSLLHAPRTLLAHTPFPSFLLPGLLLLLVVGASNALAGARLVRDLPGAYPTAFVAGGALLVWIVTEMALLRSIHWLQLGYLVVALAIVVFASLRLSARRETAAGKPHPAA